MPIQVSVERNKIAVRPKIKDSEIFAHVIGTLKSHGAVWSPGVRQAWIVHPQKWNDLLPDLQTWEDIYYLEPDTERLIDKLIEGDSQIKYFDDPLSRKDLKVQPIKGKHPYENYQWEDILNAYNTNRYAFFNDPGTGKTYDYMSVLELQRKYRNAGKVLFLTSNSGVYNMKKEFGKFTDIPEDQITVGNVKNRLPFELNKEVVVCSYRSFLLIYDEYLKKKDGTPGNNPKKITKKIDKWLGDKDGILILDESHNIANPSAQQTKAIFHVNELFEYRYEGTGTPADKLEKYYAQLKALDPKLVHGLSFTDWKIKYFLLGSNYSEHDVVGIKPEMVSVLQDKVNSVGVRRLAEDILDLPEHKFKKIYTEFTPSHRAIYEDVISGALEEIQEEMGYVDSHKVQQLFPYLVMSVDYPQGLMKHFGEKISNVKLQRAIERFNFLTSHSKIPLIDDILDDYPGEKIILWTSHPAVGNSLGEYYKSKNPWVLNGETKIPKGYDSNEWKLKVVEDFQNDPKRHLLIAGIQVLNSSVNITVCNKQIIIDTDYNYTTYEQFIKRINRLGQKEPMTTFLPLIDRSMDVVRRKSMEDKDFINKYFMSEKFLDKAKLKGLFSMVGDL